MEYFNAMQRMYDVIAYCYGDCCDTTKLTFRGGKLCGLYFWGPALLVIWIGSKIFRSIEKQNRKSELEEEVNRQIKEKLRKRMEDKTV